MDELTIIEQGMKLEREGLDFYLNAAEAAEESDTAQLFRDLAADEVDHYNYLGRQYDAIAADETWVPIPDLSAVEAIDLKAPIFPAGVQARSVLPEHAKDEDALLFALGAEVKSFELYSAAAKDIDNPEARQLLQALAGAEQQHFNTIMARYEALCTYPG